MEPPLPRRALAFCLLLAAVAAGDGGANASEPGSPARALAPGQPDFLAHRRALVGKLEEADVVGVALKRVHNALGVLLAAPGAPGPSGKLCESATARSLLARTHPLGAAYRDAVQSARAEAGRLRALLSAPTLAPLLEEPDRQTAEALVQRSAAHVRQYLEAIAWQQRLLEPGLARCEVALVPAEGLPGAAPNEGEAEPLAVIGMGGGKVCPGSFPADGRVLLLRSAKACYGVSICDCEPRPVLPGAVVGPAASGP